MSSSLQVYGLFHDIKHLNMYKIRDLCQMEKIKIPEEIYEYFSNNSYSGKHMDLNDIASIEDVPPTCIIDLSKIPAKVNF